MREEQKKAAIYTEESVKIAAEFIGNHRLPETHLHTIAALLQRNGLGQIQAVRHLLEHNDCDCQCGHHYSEHRENCARCLACKIGEAVGQ